MIAREQERAGGKETNGKEERMLQGENEIRQN